MKTRDDYLDDLRRFKETSAAKFGILSIGIFGSVARGENTQNSDLDVFVEIAKPDYYTMFDIKEALQSICGCPVDLVRKRKGLRRLLQQNIEKDGIYA